MQTFEESVDAWITTMAFTDEQAPMVFLLRKIAEQLDKRMTVGMVQQFGLTLRHLAKQVDTGEDVDELEALLLGRGV